MQILDDTLDLEAFWARVREARRRALLLDYDGTLAPFRIERDRALPYEGVRDALASIMRSGHTHLAVVSGRFSHDLIPLLDMEPRPEIWGTHGWEHLTPDDHYEIASVDTAALRILREAREWAEGVGWDDRLEAKPAGLAFHVRGLGAQTTTDVLDVVLQGWAPLADRGGLTILQFDGGVELRAPGQDKGTVVRTVLDQIGAEGVMAFLGDDQTDEDAFAAIEQLAPDRRALPVLVRPELRNSLARLWLVPPAELITFLHRWNIEAARGGG